VSDAPEPSPPDPIAYSADGREFRYEAPIAADIEVGGWVRLTTAAGERFLAQVATEDIVVRDSALGFGRGNGTEHPYGGSAGTPQIQRRIRNTEGVGVLLARETPKELVPPNPGDTFDAATIEAAEEALVSRYLDAMAGSRARLPIGTVQRCSGQPPAFLRADGFDRHTFLCGQSGSGKTYALGLVLEQLLLETNLNLVVIDPNSDFIKLDQTHGGAPTAAARRYKSRTKSVRVLRPASVARSSKLALRAWFSDLAEAEQAATLQIDPIADREEYGRLASIGDQLPHPYALADVLRVAESLDDANSRGLALRIRNLRAAEWSVWASGKEASSREHFFDGSRAIVVDVGAIAASHERSAVCAAVLGGLWRQRERREPRLIIIDEAHNVCPDEPTSALQRNATEYCINIAAEGRKFGLYLLISTQRPQKVHRNVLSQCDNLMLMRMNSRVDLAELGGAFSFVPPSLIEEAMRFRQGETLLAGRIVPAPLIASVGGRISEQGGRDIPAVWADA
jgi:DNA helicase HerA-like ATPase